MFRRGNLVVGGAGEEADEPEEEDGAYYGGYEVADDSGRCNAEEAEYPAAKDASDDAYDEIDNPAETAAAHEFPGYGAGRNTDKNIPNEAHSEIIFMIKDVIFHYYNVIGGRFVFLSQAT